MQNWIFLPHHMEKVQLIEYILYSISIDGTIKRCVDRTSKKSLDSPINTPKLMYEYFNNKIVNISFYFLDRRYYKSYK